MCVVKVGTFVRSIMFTFAVLMASGLNFVIVTSASAADGDLDQSFVSETILQRLPSARVITFQADGKVLVAGNFEEVDGHKTQSLVRINTDGTVDTTFSAAIAPEVNSSGPQAVLALANGKILVGGEFKNVDGEAKPNLARLNSDGSLDNTYNITVNSALREIHLDADGKVVIVGRFTTVNGVSRSHIARLNSDDSLDATFDPVVSNNGIESVAIQADGQFVIAGTFTDIDGITRNRVARLSSTGALDTEFDPEANSFLVAKVLVQSDQKILIAGGFTQLGGGSISQLARVESDGSLDTSFNPSPNSTVNDMALMSTGKIAVAGNFSSIGGESRGGFAVLNSDGTADTSFTAPGFGIRAGVGVDNNDNIFTSLSRPVGAVPNLKSLVAKLLANGTVDDNFALDALRVRFVPRAIADDRSGRVYLGGVFDKVGDFERFNLVRLTKDGEVDPTYAPNPDGLVDAIVAQRSGKLVIGGSFNEVAGIAKRGIARLSEDGSFDMSFVANASGISAIEQDGSGNLFMVGSSIQIANANSSRVAKFDVNGNPDPNFMRVFCNSGSIFNIKLLDDGKLMVAGNFSDINGTAYQSLARLSPDGSIDSSFSDPQISGTVTKIEVLDSGKVLVLGNFMTVPGNDPSNILVINPDGSLDTTYAGSLNSSISGSVKQPDGKVIVVGRFTSFAGTPVNFLVRLDEDGLLDPSFVSDPQPAETLELALQRDGKLLVAGNIATFNGELRQGVMRVETGVVIQNETCFVVPTKNNSAVSFCL